ncbi:MAG: hypothetical protein RL215_1521, partial [Planctomycetota bacterium]
NSSTSQLVIDEASAGKPSLTAERLQLLAGIPLLQLDPVICTPEEMVGNDSETDDN